MLRTVYNNDIRGIRKQSHIAFCPFYLVLSDLFNLLIYTEESPTVGQCQIKMWKVLNMQSGVLFIFLYFFFLCAHSSSQVLS